ncbi:hypothetical protein HanLR1_Chr07g0252921 [Helianthus annuus]|nr:hypothetical protein HanHA89_Chr07g0270601 [Helianthus annuus]KAJ0729437.1 hypothetical protein HanLR1_Chr07g0252921 [Helianthus annuus]
MKSLKKSQRSSGEYKKDLRKDGKACNDGVVGKIERRQESVQEPEGLLEKDNVEKVNASQTCHQIGERNQKRS